MKGFRALQSDSPLNVGGTARLSSKSYLSAPGSKRLGLDHDWKTYPAFRTLLKQF